MIQIAGIQFSGDAKKEKNLEKVARLASEAAARGAQVICFPELCTTTYFCTEANYAHFDSAEPIPGPSTDEACALAKRLGVSIVFPLFEREAEGQFYNAAVVIASTGQILGKYRKTSIPLSVAKDGTIAANEKMYFAPGNLGFPTFRLPEGLTLGILICYDRHFPEGARILGLNGADLVCVPTNTWRELMKEIWELELRAHAVANAYYVCGVNKVGLDRGGSPNHFFGTSLIVGPTGKVVARGGERDDEVITADVDLEHLRATRRTFPVYRDRRPDLYGPVCR
jgi:N-carbamoylputrescine amidase